MMEKEETPHILAVRLFKEKVNALAIYLTR
jgi:hypothetical protein